jgi:hypothetical protein
MELSLPWEATGCSSTQEFPNTLWNPKVYYHVNSSPVHTTQSYFSKIHLHIQIKQRNKKNRLSGSNLAEEASDPNALDHAHINTHCIMGHTYPVSYIAYYAVNKAWQMSRNMMKQSRQSWSEEIWTLGGRQSGWECGILFWVCEVAETVLRSPSTWSLLWWSATYNNKQR